MKKLILLYFISLFLCCTLFGQSKLDSLSAQLKKIKSDTSRVNLLEDIGIEYLNFNKDSALLIEKQALNLAIKINYSKGISNGYFKCGIIYSEQENYTESLAFLDKALKICEKQNIKDGMANCYNNIASVFSNRGDNYKAIDYLIKASKIYVEMGEKQILATCYINISTTYESQGKYNKSLEYAFKSLNILEKTGGKKEIAHCYRNISNIYVSQGLYDKALEYCLIALKNNKEINDKEGLSGCYTTLGMIYCYQGNNKNAMEYYLKAMKINEENDNKGGMASCFNNIGTIYSNQSNKEKALEYYLKALKIHEEIEDSMEVSRTSSNIAGLYIALSDSINITKNSKTFYLKKAVEYGTRALKLAYDLNALPVIYESSYQLQTAYTKIGDYKKAIEFANIFIDTQDSLFSAESSQALVEMGEKYESEKKQLEIDKMQKQKELDKITIEAKSNENRKQLIIIISAFVCIVIILIFSIIVLRMFRHKRKANIILGQQKEEISAQRDEIEAQRDLVITQKNHIEEIHKDLTDSINYAERIQRSFLASSEMLTEFLQEHFVIYYPKDVVSGDFYWAGILSNGNFALATADSTGHGVPGAIMSILNISSLEKAVEQGLNEPSAILNHTRRTIINRLKKDGSIDGGKDGMDLSLICFDFDNNKFTYSSANNPIWIVRENKIIELNPDKMPVGKHDKDEVPFSQEEFNLLKGDVIYSLTDGFPDQFGGPFGKKYKYAQLKDLLLFNHTKEMPEQKQILENAFMSWKGNLEQVDDITIIGIKI